MKHLPKILTLITFIVLCLLVFVEDSFAQCPMCKAAAEANMRDGGSHGLGLNTGIIYLFLTPYFLVMSIGFIWWWNNRKGRQEASAS